MNKETNVRILGVVMTTALAVQNPVGVMAANAGVDGATVSAVNVLSNEAYDELVQTYALPVQLNVGVFDDDIDRTIPYIDRFGFWSDAEERATASGQIQNYPWGAYNLTIGNYGQVSSIAVFVDDSQLGSSSYSISSSGVLKFKSSYMSTLRNGSHEVSVEVETSSGQQYSWAHAGYIVISRSSSGNKNDNRPVSGQSVDFEKDFTDLHIITRQEWGNVINSLNFKNRTIDLSNRDFIIIEGGAFDSVTSADRIIFPKNTYVLGAVTNNNLKMSALVSNMTSGTVSYVELHGVKGSRSDDSLPSQYLRLGTVVASNYNPSVQMTLKLCNITKEESSQYSAGCVVQKLIVEDDSLVNLEKLPLQLTDVYYQNTNENITMTTAESVNGLYKNVILESQPLKKKNGKLWPITALTNNSNLENLVLYKGLDTSLTSGDIPSQAKLWVYRNSEAEYWCIENNRAYDYIDPATAAKPYIKDQTKDYEGSSLDFEVNLGDASGITSVDGLTASDWSLTGNTLTFNKDWLDTLPEGTKDVSVTFDDGTTVANKIHIVVKAGSGDTGDTGDTGNEGKPEVKPVITVNFYKDKPRDIIIPFTTGNVSKLTIGSSEETGYEYNNATHQLKLPVATLEKLAVGSYPLIPEFETGDILNNIVLEVWDKYNNSFLPKLYLAGVNYVNGDIPLDVYLGKGEHEAHNVTQLVCNGKTIDNTGAEAHLNSLSAGSTDLFYVNTNGKLVVTEDAVKALDLKAGNSYTLGCVFDDSLSTESLNRVLINVYSDKADIPDAGDTTGKPDVSTDNIVDGDTEGGSTGGGGTGGTGSGDSTGGTGSGDGTGGTGTGGNTGSGDSGNTGGNTGSGDSGNTGGNTGSGDSGNTGGSTGGNTGTGGSGSTGGNTGGSGSTGGSSGGSTGGSGSGSGGGSWTGGSTGGSTGGTGSSTGSTGGTGTGSTGNNGSGACSSGNNGSGSGSTGGTGTGTGSTGGEGTGSGSGTVTGGNGNGSSGTGDNSSTGNGSSTGTGSTGNGSGSTGTGSEAAKMKIPNAVFVKDIPVGSIYQIRLINRNKVKSYSFKSTDTSVASVTNKGLVKIKKKGIAKIQVRTRNKDGNVYRYTLKLYATSGKPVKDTSKNLRNIKCKSTLPIARFIKTVKKGSQYQMTVISDSKIHYRVGNPRVAKVDSSGKVQTLKKGKTHVTAVIKQNGLIYKYKVLLVVK